MLQRHRVVPEAKQARRIHTHESILFHEIDREGPLHTAEFGKKSLEMSRFSQKTLASSNHELVLSHAGKRVQEVDNLLHILGPKRVDRALNGGNVFIWGR